MNLIWLSTRKNMFLKVFIDFILLFFLRSSINSQLNFLDIKFFFIIFFLLISIGYIVGKYHNYKTTQNLKISQYIKTLCTEYIISSSILGIIFIILMEDIDYRLIKFLFFFLLFSNFINFLFDMYIHRHKNDKKEN